MSYEPSRLVYGISKAIFRATHAWRMSVEGFENIPKEPSIVLAKHRSHKEVMQLSYLLHCRTGIIPLIIMKASLPDCLGWFGGVPFYREKDTELNQPKKAVENRKGLQYIANGIATEKRSALIFVEGTRKPTSMGDIKLMGVHLLERSCKSLGATPPISLIGVEHGYCMSKFRVGDTMQYAGKSSLEEEVIREKLAALSGIDLKAQQAAEKSA